MAICGCGLPACCCQPAVAGGVIYADLWGELNTHLALQALFTQSSPVREPLLQAFPFPSTLGRWHCTHFLSPVCLFTVHGEVGLPPSPVGFSSHRRFYKLSRSWLLGVCPASWCVCLQLTWEVGLPPSSVEFSSLCCFYKLSCSWLLGVCLAPAVSGRLFYLRFWEGFPSPTLALRVPRPLCYVSLLFLLLITQFLFFPWLGVSLSRGLCWSGQGCLWEFHVPLTSPCGPCLPKQSGHWCLVTVWEPSWFLRLTWSGDALRRLEVWRGQSFASSSGFSWKGVSPASLQDFTLGGMLSASSL
jgi:hypothetical protein